MKKVTPKKLYHKGRQHVYGFDKICVDEVDLDKIRRKLKKLKVERQGNMLAWKYDDKPTIYISEKEFNVSDEIDVDEKVEMYAYMAGSVLDSFGYVANWRRVE